MKYYIRETVFDEVRNLTAASKAREDINKIAERMGFKAVDVEYDYSLRKKRGFFPALSRLTKDWSKALSGIGEGDVLLIQYPINHHPIGMARKFRQIRKKGGRIILLIHDIDCLRMDRKSVRQKTGLFKVWLEDMTILRQGDAVIAHNRKMIKRLKEMGIKDSRMISLDIFDYLVNDEAKFGRHSLKSPVVIAGTLRRGKAGYVYSLPDDVDFNLYGVGYDEDAKDNIKYNGSFRPEDLPEVMEGSFGLVWDGASGETCEGNLAGEYLKLNNPHKTSLYLASGMPVITWRKAAVTDFVNERGCGLSVDSLSDLHDVLDKLTENEYALMTEKASVTGEKIRKGEFAETAINRALELVIKSYGNINKQTC